MAGCFRFKRELDDLRLEWDGYIDSTSSEDNATASFPDSQSVPSVDMLDKHAAWAADDPGKMFQTYKGQLKLSVYVNYGLLTLHVVQARHLASKHRSTCDAYIKLSLVPDESKRTRCKTEVVPDTNNPLFDEKFSFELLEEDMKKRIIISVWNKVQGREMNDEFLGCMSFGIRHIQTDSKRAVNGWYYLLTEEVGRRKHLQAVVRRQHLREQTTNNIPEVNQDIMWMEPHTVVVKKTRTGYGFIVTGSCPVQVSRVDKGSPADQAGLLKDDCIVRIDGMNVSRSTSDSVAKLIRHTHKYLSIEIQRPHVMQTSQPSSWQPVSSTPMTSSAPKPHIPGLPIVSKPPLPPPPPPPKFDQELDNRGRVYGDCGVFGESDPIYSGVVMPGCRSSASSSGGSAEPLYGMIRVPRSRSSIAAPNLDSVCGTCSLPRSRASSSGGSGDMPMFGTMPRNRNSIAMAPAVTNYATLQFPRSYSTAAITKQYSLCPEPEGIYGSTGSSGGTVTSQNSHDDYGVYGEAQFYGSTGSAGGTRTSQNSHDDYGVYGGVYGEAQFYGSTGSAGSGRSSGSGRARTLPRPKKKVTFQEFR